MQDSTQDYHFLGPLPPLAPTVQRVRVRDRRLGRDIEFRILVKEADQAARAAFLAEAAELLRIDHASFPTVLDIGQVRSRPCYTVPFRDRPTLARAARAGGLTLAEATVVARDTAEAMAACHRAGLPLPGFDPRWLQWDAATASCTVLHRTRAPPRYVSRTDLLLPADVRASDGALAPRRDVFHWGVFAYYCLTGGQYPYQASDAGLLPLRELVPDLPAAWATPVEAALTAEPSGRPRWGGEILAVLDRGLSEPVATPPKSLSDSSQLFQWAFSEAVESTRLEGLAELGADASLSPVDATIPESEELSTFLDDLHELSRTRPGVPLIELLGAVDEEPE